MVRKCDAYARNASVLKMIMLIVLYTGYGLGHIITTITTNSAYRISNHVITAHIIPQISCSGEMDTNHDREQLKKRDNRSKELNQNSLGHTTLHRHSIDCAYLCYAKVCTHNPYLKAISFTICSSSKNSTAVLH